MVVLSRCFTHVHHVVCFVHMLVCQEGTALTLQLHLGCCAALAIPKFLCIPHHQSYRGDRNGTLPSSDEYAGGGQASATMRIPVHQVLAVHCALCTVHSLLHCIVLLCLCPRLCTHVGGWDGMGGCPTPVLTVPKGPSLKALWQNCQVVSGSPALGSGLQGYHKSRCDLGAIKPDTRTYT